MSIKIYQSMFDILPKTQALKNCPNTFKNLQKNWQILSHWMSGVSKYKRGALNLLHIFPGFCTCSLAYEKISHNNINLDLVYARWPV